MKLHEYLNKDHIQLCNDAGIDIKNEDYSREELYELEHDILEYTNQNCANEKVYKLVEKYDEIIDIIMDLENESEELNPTTLEVFEDDHVELSNGKYGIVADITNNVYTIEIDEDFKTGNLDEDIMIVAANSIIGKV